MNSAIVRKDNASIVGAFKPFAAGCRACWNGWTVWPDRLLDGLVGPVENTEGSATKATPHSIPSARRRAIRVLVIA
jgi:hypothetical protein